MARTVHQPCRSFCERFVDRVRQGDDVEDMLEAGVMSGLVRTWSDPRRFVYAVHKGLGRITTSWRQMWCEPGRRLCCPARVASHGSSRERIPAGPRRQTHLSLGDTCGAGRDAPRRDNRFKDDLLTTGATPLLPAAQIFDNDVVRALLAHGALVDLPNASA